MATIGTLLFTMIRGTLVGTDPDGNRYYTERSPRPDRPARRWVIYKGDDDASRVSAEWHAWLHYTTPAPLNAVKRHSWQAPHQANPTGTPAAYFPPGHDLAGGRRDPATGDYQAWTP